MIATELKTRFACALFIATVLTASAIRAAPGTASIFSEMAAESGLDFVHFNGMSGELYMVEVMGSGVALFDYDNDGDLDVYFVQGQMLGADKTTEDAIFPPMRPAPLTDRLFRNDTIIEKNNRRTLKFTDVTEAAGIKVVSYGMGVITGDIDNDGWIDLYVTAFGHNQLLRNNGDGTFVDITTKAGVDDPGWSVSASFFDYDRDGLLDLFVVNYVDFGLDNVKPCFTNAAIPEYCGPLTHNPVPDKLFRNLGNGRFEDVTKKSGISQTSGNGLGIVTADFDKDGLLDCYVANDGVANQLWLNQGDGTFVDDASLAGAAFNIHGAPEASMGVDAADYDDDGDEDIFLTHLTQESNTLYRNDGTGWFEDVTAASGLGPPSFPYTGFGTAMFDYDNDGQLDIIAVNGAVIARGQITDANPYPVDQTNQLYYHAGNARYENVTADGGAVFTLSEVSRGMAVGDVDNDGDSDVVILNNSGPARLLVNELGHDRSWIGFRLVDETGRYDMLGAVATVDGNRGQTLSRRVRTDGSYASARDPRLLFGLGDTGSNQTIRVKWPDGNEESWENLAVKHYHTIRKGTGQMVK